MGHVPLPSLPQGYPQPSPWPVLFLFFFHDLLLLGPLRIHWIIVDISRDPIEMICKSGRRTTLFKHIQTMRFINPRISKNNRTCQKKHDGWSKNPMYLIKSYKINIKSSFVRMTWNHVKPSGLSGSPVSQPPFLASSFTAPASPPSPPPAAAPAPPPPPQAANLPKPLVISSWALVVKHFWVG